MTIRERDSMAQERVALDQVESWLGARLGSAPERRASPAPQAVRAELRPDLPRPPRRARARSRRRASAPAASTRWLVEAASARSSASDLAQPGLGLVEPVVVGEHDGAPRRAGPARTRPRRAPRRGRSRSTAASTSPCLASRWAPCRRTCGSSDLAVELVLVDPGLRRRGRPPRRWRRRGRRCPRGGRSVSARRAARERRAST